MDGPYSEFWAHWNPDTKQPHALEAHLRDVGTFAGKFATAFGGGDWGRVAGLWHDLGKYRGTFQTYIRRVTGEEAHIEGRLGRVEHSAAGAVHAVERFLSEKGKKNGYLLAYLIAGHHAGLPDFLPTETGNAALEPRLHHAREDRHLPEALSASIPPDILNPPLPESQPPGATGAERAAGLHLWVRFLFSCLVDADFLDTERFMNPERADARTGLPELAQLAGRYNTHMAKLRQKADPTPVNQIRNTVLEAAIAAAAQVPGLFSLSVPTGGGKTLASLGFALHHAQRHGKHRIVYVIPYTSIIEQTADVFRGVFAGVNDAVVEHHSNIEIHPDSENHRTRLACENWDAPLIVTTSVQFFESLYAARPSRVRKLHNLVNSVVILDEVQLLPPEFRATVVRTLGTLARHYGLSIVLCTATQPALGLEGVREIAPDPVALHHALKRVKCRLPASLNTPVSWETLAAELSRQESVLCIVNRRDDCRVLHALMPGGTHHLSALMCGEHRTDVIARIKSSLKEKQPISVISTQLVEAGVDLDFPVVYRALAGLDSIAQAAGRCNREGALPHPGQVHVFVPPSRNPGLLYKAALSTQELLHGTSQDPLGLELSRRYFELFYSRIDGDKKGIEDMLQPQGAFGMALRSAAEAFRLIDDGYHQPVFVAYGERGPTLLDELRKHGPERSLMRKLQRFCVNVTEGDLRHLLSVGAVRELERFPGTYIQALPGAYDDRMGLKVRMPGGNAIFT